MTIGFKIDSFFLLSLVIGLSIKFTAVNLSWVLKRHRYLITICFTLATWVQTIRKKKLSFEQSISSVYIASERFYVYFLEHVCLLCGRRNTLCIISVSSDSFQFNLLLETSNRNCRHMTTATPCTKRAQHAQANCCLSSNFVACQRSLLWCI